MLTAFFFLSYSNLQLPLTCTWILWCGCYTFFTQTCWVSLIHVTVWDVRITRMFSSLAVTRLPEITSFTCAFPGVLITLLCIISVTKAISAVLPVSPIWAFYKKMKKKINIYIIQNFDQKISKAEYITIFAMIGPSEIYYGWVPATKSRLLATWIPSLVLHDLNTIRFRIECACSKESSEIPHWRFDEF